MKKFWKLWVFSAAALACIAISIILFLSIMKRYRYLDNYSEGYREFLRGNYEKSSSHFEECLSTYPRFRQILPLLAASYYYQGDFERSGRLFQTVGSRSGKAGEILSEYSRAAAMGKADRHVRKNTIEKLNGISSQEPNILANIEAIAAQEEFDSGDIDKHMGIITKYIFGQKEIQFQPLALAYDALGCLALKKSAYREALESFNIAANFAIRPAVHTAINRNRLCAELSALKHEMKDRDGGFADRFTAKISSLKGDDLFNAQLILSSFYMKKGRDENALNILDSIATDTPSKEIQVQNIRIQLMLKKTRKSGKTSHQAHTISKLIEENLKKIEKNPSLKECMSGLKPLFYFISGYYHAEGNFRELEKITSNALKFFPDDYSFARNLGIIKLKAGQYGTGLALIKRSMQLNGDQPDLALYLEKSLSGYQVGKMRFIITAPFSRKQPLVKIRYEKNEYQPNPVIRNMTAEGAVFSSIVTGNVILGVPETPVVSPSDFRIQMQAVNPLNGKAETFTVSASQDLVPPRIRVIFPSKGSSVSFKDFHIQVTIEDTGSGVDLASLQISIDSGKSSGTIEAVKSGVFKTVRESRGRRVGTNRIKFKPVIPVTGKYSLSITVYDKSGNKAHIRNWDFFLKP